MTKADLFQSVKELNNTNLSIMLHESSLRSCFDWVIPKEFHSYPANFESEEISTVP